MTKEDLIADHENYKEQQKKKSHGRMIGYDETIALFREVANYISDNDMADDELIQDYTYAMNRLHYERDKAEGAEVNKLKKNYEAGHFYSCGNCGSSAIDGKPHYKYCPACGYKLIWK